MNRQQILWLLTFTFLAALYLPVLVQQGMFLDGITYSAISKNLSQGLGSAFDPHYTKTLYPHFREHPPLVFIIQSFFFDLFGDGFLTERIYCLVVVLATVLPLAMIWRLTEPRIALKNLAWLPVLLWLTIPLNFWAYRNNLLEDTLGVFTLFAVYFILKALLRKKPFYLLPAMLCLIGAFLAKGFVGLFPLAVPVAYALTWRNFRRPVIYTIWLSTGSAILFISLLLIFPELKVNLAEYIDRQLLPALANKREVTTSNRFAILGDLLLELLLPTALILFFGLRGRFKSARLHLRFSKEAQLFLLIALAASLPLLITLKQRKYYLIPSIPFYLLAASAVLAPCVRVLVQRISTRALSGMRIAAGLGCVAIVVIAVFVFGSYSRDSQKLGDVYRISGRLPKGAVIATSTGLAEDWSLNAYLSRVGYISLDCCHPHRYYLIEKDSNALIGDTAYSVVDLHLENYILLEKKN